jgi:F-type H+-transporting ATPase subunit gamma
VNNSTKLLVLLNNIMGGAGLISIKRRIKSVTNTRKITKAMGLVATAKLRKTREKLTFNERYYDYTVTMMKKVIDNFEGESVYTNGNKSKKKLYLVFTSEMGLCGAFNGNVISSAVQSIKSDIDNSIIMVVGQKGKNYFNRLKYDTAAEYVEVPDVPTIKEAGMIAAHAMELFINGEVGEINVVYTKFTSAVNMSVLIEKVLPIPFVLNYSYKDFIVFEPSVDEVLENYINQYVREMVMFSLLNSKASEHASRMNAMDAATNNANELLEKLSLKYNRIRQSSITQEISEIVGGAEAQR